jgi:hypothetical protein
MENRITGTTRLGRSLVAPKGARYLNLSATEILPMQLRNASSSPHISSGSTAKPV